MPDAIDYQRGPNEAEQRDVQRQKARRDRAIRWLVIIVALAVVVVCIFLNNLPVRLIDSNGYTR